MTRACALCGGDFYALGLCQRHYNQDYWNRRRATTTPCDIDDCRNPVWARDMCSMHYQRWRNHGDATALDQDTAQGLLMWLRDKGASDTWLADQLPLGRANVWQIRTGQRTRVRRSTSLLIQRLVHRVAVGAVIPPDYIEAEDRRIARERRRAYRKQVAA